MKKNNAALYIVATPIGNLQDMSARAIEVLKSVACIAAEDTRHSASLLQQFNISTPTLSLHDYNERDRVERILERLQQGESIALISDAGTPLISDPGYFLVKEAREAGIRIVPLPGPCAAIVALSAAGLPTDKFIFEGFLPAKTKARVDRLTFLANETRTMIFYEAPHRILDLLEDMQKVFGDDRMVVIARELTKMFETIHSANLKELIAWVKSDSNQERGEMVVIVKGIEEASPIANAQVLLELLLKELPLKKAVEIAAQVTNEKRNELYEMGLQIKNAKEGG
jgi:16S rRNA (cytidine1402-2'-O)-methyltransferase